MPAQRKKTVLNPPSEKLSATSKKKKTSESYNLKRKNEDHSETGISETQSLQDPIKRNKRTTRAKPGASKNKQAKAEKEEINLAQEVTDLEKPCNEKEDPKDNSLEECVYLLDSDENITKKEDNNTIVASDSCKAKFHKLDIKTYDDAMDKFGEIPFNDLRKITPQAIFFDRITTRGRKPQNINAEEFLDEEQINAAAQRKLTYRDMSMLSADAVFPHVVLVNLGAIAFFTDLDCRLEIAVDANERRLNKAMNNPNSPLYKNSISFDSSLRNSPYDMPILSHPSAYFVCIVPSHQFSYASRSGQSAIGKGRSFFRMIKKRCIEIITLNLGEGSHQTADSVAHGINEKTNVAHSCPFVDIPPYYIEKTIEDDEQSGFSIKFESKSMFEKYLSEHLHGTDTCEEKEAQADAQTSNQPETVDDAICRLALYYHATLDKRIPITIVSQSDNASMSHTNRKSPKFPLFETIKALCPNRLITNVPARRKEWIDTLSDDLQRNCKLKRKLTADDILCISESPLLRGDKNDWHDSTKPSFLPKNGSVDQTQTENPQKHACADAENLPLVSKQSEESGAAQGVPQMSNPISFLLNPDTVTPDETDYCDNPIASLFG